jgi:ABC-type branched-subunit amino acid transport system substrate-binding protein
MRPWVFSCLLFTLSTPGLAAAKIGYGSSTAVVSPSYQENVLRGFELGVARVLGPQSPEKSPFLVKQINDKSIQGATVAANALVDSGVVALVGFPVSHDALLAADVARKAGVLAIFGSPSHTAIAEKGPLVYSTGASISTLQDDLLQFLMEKFPGKKGLAIVNPTSVFSINQETLLKSKIPTLPKLTIEIARLADGLVMPEAILSRMKKGEFDYLYLSVYPDDLVALFNQMQAARVDLPMVAFGGPDPEILRRFIAGKKAPYFIGTTWVPSDPDMKALDKEVFKKYGKNANFETVIGYNLGMVVGQVLKTNEGPLTKESVLASFRKKSCYPVLGRNELCFGPNGGHATSQGLRFARFSQVGLEAPKANP